MALGCWAHMLGSSLKTGRQRQIQKKDIDGAGDALPVGPALDFLAKKEKENLFSLLLEYPILQFDCSEYHQYVSDISQHRSSEPLQTGVYLEKHLLLSDHHHRGLSGAFMLGGDRNGQNTSHTPVCCKTESKLSDDKTSASSGGFI